MVAEAQAGGGAPPGGGGGMPGGGGGMPGGGGGRSSGSSSSTTSDTDLMTMEQINTLQENFSDKISSISISESGASGKVKNDTTFANISTVGTNVGYQDVKSITMKEGRYLAQNDIDGAKNVAVVSDKLVTKIFGDSVDPINKEIKVYTSRCYLYIYCSWSIYV